MSVTIVDKDNGYKHLLVTVRKMHGTSVKVGVSDAPHVGTPGMTIADIGAIHEFGGGTVPQRSFLRAWVDEHRSEWFSWLRRGIVGALFGRTQSWADDYGKYAVAGVRAKILSNIPPPLADETARRKQGNDIALVDTGQLLEGIEYEVEGAR